MNEPRSESLRENARFEYARALELYTFHHAWRMKILGFTMAVESLIAYAISQSALEIGERIGLAIFAFLITVCTFAIERLSSNVTRIIWCRMCILEDTLDAELMTIFERPTNWRNRFRQKHWLGAIYYLIFLAWLCVLFALCLHIAG